MTGAGRPWWRRMRDRVTRPHVCDPRPDPFFPDDVRCRCGRRPEPSAARTLTR